MIEMEKTKRDSANYPFSNFNGEINGEMEITFIGYSCKLGRPLVVLKIQKLNSPQFTPFSSLISH